MTSWLSQMLRIPSRRVSPVMHLGPRIYRERREVRRLVEPAQSLQRGIAHSIVTRLPDHEGRRQREVYRYPGSPILIKFSRHANVSSNKRVSSERSRSGPTRTAIRKRSPKSLIFCPRLAASIKPTARNGSWLLAATKNKLLWGLPPSGRYPSHSRERALPYPGIKDRMKPGKAWRQ